MKKKIIAFLALASGVTILSAGYGYGYGSGPQHREMKGMYASGGPCGMERHHRRGGGAMQRKSSLKRVRALLFRRLDLSPDQKHKVTTYLWEYRQALKKERPKSLKREKGERARQGRGRELARLLGAEDFDNAAFMTEMQKRQAEMERFRKVRLELLADTLEKIHGVLTPEQRQKLIQFPERRRGGRG